MRNLHNPLYMHTPSILDFVISILYTRFTTPAKSPKYPILWKACLGLNRVTRLPVSSASPPINRMPQLLLFSACVFCNYEIVLYSSPPRINNLHTLLVLNFHPSSCHKDARFHKSLLFTVLHQVSKWFRPIVTSHKIPSPTVLASWSTRPSKYLSWSKAVGTACSLYAAYFIL